LAAPATPVEILDEIDSTNAEARRRAETGRLDPVWIAARRQTAGRGRRGRAWASVQGNLHATGLFHLNASPAEAAQLSFAAALAAAETVEAACEPERVRVKWPNDVLVDGRKIAGLLLESAPVSSGGLWLAVGVGINLAWAPDDAERPATSLLAEGGRLDVESALARLSARFDAWRARWAGEGFAPIRDAWLARAYGLGDPCEVRLDHETLHGRFADLEADGSLRLELRDGGRRSISAGDVFFPGAVR